MERLLDTQKVKQVLIGQRVCWHSLSTVLDCADNATSNAQPKVTGRPLVDSPSLWVGRRPKRYTGIGYPNLD